MRLYVYLRYIIFFSIFLIILYMFLTRDSLHLNRQTQTDSKEPKDRDDTYIAEHLVREPEVSLELKLSDVVVATVICGNRTQEAFTMMHSALMFSKKKIFFIIFAEDALYHTVSEKVEWLSILARDSFSYKIMHIKFPVENQIEWKLLFKPCAAQRLFFPSLLPDVDSLLYVDTDILFLTAVEEVWDHFRNFNESQLAALAPEDQDPNVGWYSRFARHPYYGKLGLNSGVMLMNLTRMRKFKWEEYVKPIYKKYKNDISWGDQDIINIIFHYHPGKVYVYPCRYNYRADFCMYTSTCKSAEQSGVAVLHGNRGMFHSKKQIIFGAFYRAVQNFQLGSDLTEDFYNPLNEFLDQVGGSKGSRCDELRDVFMKNLQKYL